MIIVPARQLSYAEMHMLGNNVLPAVLCDRRQSRVRTAPTPTPHSDGWTARAGGLASADAEDTLGDH